MAFQRKKSAASNQKPTLRDLLKWRHILPVLALIVLAILAIHVSTILNQKTIYPGISVEMLALTAVSEGKQVEHISPCGGCRQVMTEVENRYKQSIKLLFCGRDEIVRLDSAESLLPLSFGDADLLR